MMEADKLNKIEDGDDMVNRRFESAIRCGNLADLIALLLELQDGAAITVINQPKVSMNLILLAVDLLVQHLSSSAANHRHESNDAQSLLLMPTRRIGIVRLLLSSELFFQQQQQSAFSHSIDNPFSLLNQMVVLDKIGGDVSFWSLFYRRVGTYWSFDSKCCEKKTMTPLTACLIFAAFNYAEPCLQPNDVKLRQLVNNAILPLLGQGARLGFDPDSNQTYCCHPGFWSIYDLFAVTASVDAAHTTRNNLFSRILIACSRTSAFSWRRLQTAVDDYLVNLPDNQRHKAETVRRMVSFVETQFPLRLQDICRIAIMRQLDKTKPRNVGYNRLEAIDANLVILPMRLRNFLKFADLAYYC